MNGRACTIEDCGRHAKSLGLCTIHYQRQQRAKKAAANG